MSALDRLRRVQRELQLAVACDAVLWGACVIAGLLALDAMIDRFASLPLSLRAVLPWEAMAFGLAVATWRVLRAGRLRDETAVALWIERAAPTLRYALVTRIDPAGATEAVALERAIARVAFEPNARRAAWRPLARPAIALAITAAVLGALPAGAVARVVRPTAGDIVRATRDAGNALAHIGIRVIPPTYTGLAPSSLDDAVRVAAVHGSEVRVSLARTGPPVQARSDSAAVSVAVDADRWSIALRMSATPTVLHLLQGARERLLLLEPRADSAPTVVLTSPARDTVLRSPTGTLRLGADVTDDFGLADAWFEIVVSSGEGENFRFRTLTIARIALANARMRALGGALRLDSLGLEPGDLLHLRAVARDRNNVTGPGIGASETRAIRIARASEYDSVAFDGVPPPEALKGVISQRMLILLAEKLLRQQAALTRASFVAEAGQIARDQNALRKQVGDIIFSRLDAGGGGEESRDNADTRANMTPEQLLAAANEATQRSGGEALDFADGESPVVNINRPLLEAYNAMWDAGRELGIADPRRALPHMRAALKAIEKARAAERIYLRGRPKDVIVDVPKVRLAGKRDQIGPAGRRPRASEDDATLRRLARFDRAIATLVTSGAAAADSLLLLRVELLAVAPAAAAPLGDALDRLRSGADATGALIAARRALAGERSVAAPLGAWGRVP